MKLILLTTLAAIAAADVSHLTGYPFSTYNTPQKTVTGDSQLFSYSTTASPALSLPFKEHQDFGAQFGNIGAIGYSTPAPYLAGGLVSSTPAPYLADSSVSSTPAPFLNEALVSSTQSPLFGGLVSSTAAPSLDLNSVAAGNDAGFNSAGLSFAIDGVGISNADSGFIYSSTAAPAQNLNYGPPAFASASFNLGPAVTPISTSGGSINEAFGQSGYEVQVRPQEVNKQVYFYSAPEDYEPIQTRIRVAPETPVKKNIRYIFIKAPSAPSLGRVEIAAPPQAEEKTVVYVLAKKPDLEQQIVVKSAPTTEAPKPEVYFLKYNNQKEAEEAIAKARGGNVEGRVSAYSHEGSNEFVGSINKESARAQPIINYSNVDGQESISSGFNNLNYAGAFPSGIGDTRFRFNTPPTGHGSQLFLSQPAAAQLNRGFGYTAPAAPIQYNSGLSYTTSAPIQFQSFSTPSPTVNIGSGFKSVFSGFNSPLVSSTSEPSFVSSTTASPIQFQSFSTPASVNIGSGFKSVFSGFNSPLVSSTYEPSFGSSTVAPEISVSSTPAPFSTYGLRK